MSFVDEVVDSDFVGLACAWQDAALKKTRARGISIFRIIDKMGFCKHFGKVTTIDFLLAIRFLLESSFIKETSQQDFLYF